MTCRACQVYRFLLTWQKRESSCSARPGCELGSRATSVGDVSVAWARIERDRDFRSLQRIGVLS
jgi:hypothetical protein